VARIFQCGFEAENFDIFDYFDGTQSAGFSSSTAGGWSNVTYYTGFYSNGFDLALPGKTTYTEVYGGDRIKVTNTRNDYEWFQWHDGNLTRQVLFYMNLGRLEVRIGTNNSPTLISTKASLLKDTWYWVEYYLKIHATTGAVIVKINGEEWINESNINTVGNAAGNLRWLLMSGTSTGNYSSWHDDIVVNDTVNDGGPLVTRSWPGEVGIFRTLPNADGSTLEWTPTVFAIGGPPDTPWDTGSVGAYDTEVLADTPKLYWELNETSGTSAADSSGNSHPGTYGSSVTLNVEGILANSPGVSLVNDTNGYIEVANHADLNPTAAVSLECWIKGMHAGDSWGGGSECVIMQKHGQYSLRGDARPFDFTIYFSVWVGSTRYDLSHTFPASSGTEREFVVKDTLYHHVVATYDGSNMRVYVDGTLRAETTRTGSLDTTTNVFRVGRGAGGSTYINGNNGYVDEAAIYSSALSAARIMTHFTAGVEPWQFLKDDVLPLSADAGTDARYTDRAGNERDLYLATVDPNKIHLVSGEDLDSGWPLVQGVGIWYGARKSAPGTVKVASVLKRAGNSEIGATTYQSTSWHVYRDIYGRDPTDDTDWTPTKVNNLEFGVKSIT
jgi:hypothetical protein